jgi:FKBP-type peptidyl-prolyl cis-trans isomerase
MLSSWSKRKTNKVLTMERIPGFLSMRQIIKPGAGRTVAVGNKVTVHATGSVKETGYKFWSTKDAGQKPFEFPAGLGRVITGWDQGVLGMQINEVRLLEIPATEGYGPGGFPAWKIPANATLIFEIEVLSIA